MLVLLDDNCTTCGTFQVARDYFVKRHADVAGAIAVRFPSSNRRVQMGMEGHGFPDPEILLSFVRGLVAPSPYARLVRSGVGRKKYLDQTKVFDKSRERINRYLYKNESSRIENV